MKRYRIIAQNRAGSIVCRYYQNYDTALSFWMRSINRLKRYQWAELQEAEGAVYQTITTKQEEL